MKGYFYTHYSKGIFHCFVNILFHYRKRQNSRQVLKEKVVKRISVNQLPLYLPFYFLSKRGAHGTFLITEQKKIEMLHMPLALLL